MTVGPIDSPEGERRQLTVMFCDLVGSTDLASRLDPEDLRDVIRQYQECCTRVIAEHEGFVAQYLGDGIMAYFGYPTAQEDAAERSIRAGLHILRDIRGVKLSSGCVLEGRIGVATGLAVVGDLIGRGASELSAVIGAVPNIAARLQAIASPGTLVIADSTKRLLGDLFRLQSLGAPTMKGVSPSTEIWRVVGERPEALRFDSLRGAALSRIVGRNAEVEQLGAAWAVARGGHGQVVWISGEAGIGKSRLLRAIADLAATTGAVCISLQCSGRRVASPFHPLVSYLERTAAIEDGDSPTVKQEKIEQIVSSRRLEDEIPLLMSLLSVPPTDRYPLLAASPEQKRHLTLEMLVNRMLALSDDEPLLLMLEDAQWIDPSTADLAEKLIDRLQDRPVLMLIAARPEYMPGWAGRSHVHAVQLRPLEASASRELVSQVAGERELSTEIATAIIDKTDGVPLFVEELTKGLLESVRADTGVMVDEHALRVIPSSLQDILMARLDRQGSAKTVAQVGAALGRTFTLPILRTLVGWDDKRLFSALESLMSAELIFSQGQSATAEFVFKHALVQDAAYDSMLRGRRRALHASIARALEESFPEVVAAEPETAAHHWALSGEQVKAATYGLKAAQRELARFANIEAIGHAIKALDQVEASNESAARGVLPFNLNLLLGQAYYVVQGPGAPATVAAYSRAQDLVEAVSDSEQRCALLYGIFASYHFAARPDLAAGPATRMLEISLREQNPWHLCQAHRMLGYISFFRGECERALSHFSEISRLYEPKSFGVLAPRYGADCLVGSLGFQVLIECLQGSVSSARRMADENLTYARRLGHPATTGWAFASQAYLCYFVGDSDAGYRAAADGVDFCRDNNVAAWGAHCEVFFLWATARQNGGGGYSDLIRSGIVRAKTRTELGVPMLRGVLADVLCMEGRVAEAVDETDRAIVEISSTGQYFFEGPVLLSRAAAIARLSAPAPAIHAAYHAAAEAAECRGQALIAERARAPRLPDPSGVLTPSSLLER